MTDTRPLAAFIPHYRCRHCTCDPTLCETDDTGQHCADRSCGSCLHGCPDDDPNGCDTCQALDRFGEQIGQFATHLGRLAEQITTVLAPIARQFSTAVRNMHDRLSAVHTANPCPFCQPTNTATPPRSDASGNAGRA